MKAIKELPLVWNDNSLTEQEKYLHAYMDIGPLTYASISQRIDIHFGYEEVAEWKRRYDSPQDRLVDRYKYLYRLTLRHESNS